MPKFENWNKYQDPRNAKIGWYNDILPEGRLQIHIGKVKDWEESDKNWVIEWIVGEKIGDPPYNKSFHDTLEEAKQVARDYMRKNPYGGYSKEDLKEDTGWSRSKSMEEGNPYVRYYEHSSDRLDVYIVETGDIDEDYAEITDDFHYTILATEGISSMEYGFADTLKLAIAVAEYQMERIMDDEDNLRTEFRDDVKLPKKLQKARSSEYKIN